MTDHAIKRELFWITLCVLFLVFIYLIQGVLLPFVLGIGAAYFLHPATDRLERLGLPRWLATLAMTSIFFVGFISLSLIIVPVIVDQMAGLIAAFPVYVHDFDQKYGPSIARWLGRLPDSQADGLKDAVTGASGFIVKIGEQFIGGVFQSGVAVINLLALVLITPVVAFYLLRDWDALVKRFNQLLPRPHAATIREQLSIIDRTLAGFVRGQLNVCAILAAYYGLGLSLVGLKFGIVIGLLTGLLVIVPYVGFLAGMALGLTVAFFQFDTAGPIIAVLAVFLAGTAMEGSMITPRLVGSKVGLHPVWIIFGLLAGAAMFGFVGALLAVPVTAVMGVLIRFAIGKYMESEYYRGPEKKSK